MDHFSDFKLAHPLDEVLKTIGYETPTPVQAKAIPLVLEGRDVLATAQTGTGKTAAFALPLLSKMLNGWRKQVLICAPTRELAEQIGAVLVELTQKTPELRISVVIGGTSYQQQIRSLRNTPAFVVGTPGRLLDQVELGHLRLKDFGALVIDEADRMLDMGFEPQMKQLVGNLSSNRQSLLFSATLPEEIIRLANEFLRDPVRVTVGAVTKPIEKIRQDVIKVTVDKKDQRLIEEIDKVAGSVIIFVKTKWKTEKLAKFLANAGHDVARIHGDRSQTQRSGAIKDFREGRSRILVATDIAARGIDITHIAHVVNYDLPMSPEDYIHRIGRTARAGADGHSISFVTPGEMMLWARIHKLIHGRYPDEHPGRAFGRSGADANKPRGKQSEQENKRLDYRRAEGGFRGGKASTVKPSATTKPSAKQAMKPGPQSFNKPPLRQHRDKPSDGASKFAPPSPRRQNEKRAQEFLKNERSQHLELRPKTNSDRPVPVEHKTRIDKYAGNKEGAKRNGKLEGRQEHRDDPSRPNHKPTKQKKVIPAWVSALKRSKNPPSR